MTLTNFKILGNSPAVIDLLKSLDNISEKVLLFSFSMMVGMLLGPLTLVDFKLFIILDTSIGAIGFRKMEVGFLFLRKDEKWTLDDGIL